MFTVCPKCALTLVVTAADLRVAQGYVRCGRCLNVFNALARLSEERPAAAPEPLPDTAPDAAPEPPEATVAASPQQAPAPAQPPAPEQAPAPPQSHAFAEPPTQASTLDDTGEIEIELDPSIFVTAVRPPLPQETVAEPEPEPSLGAAAGTETDTSPPDPAVVLEPEKIESISSPEPPDAPQTNTVQPLPESAFEVAGLRPRAGLGWKVGAGALTIVLALQIVNHYRDALAANPALRGPLSTVYSTLGVKLAPRWNIHAYDVRQLGASVSGAAAGEIIVRASVKNSAGSAQPLPLLRVTLQDRFGNRIAARDVPPGDYLPSSVAASSLLAAGSRVDATMVFVDPGPQAVGFEIDACLRQRGGAVACAHEP
jgi:predicted Zn finger-like uncharacterized protein